MYFVIVTMFPSMTLFVIDNNFCFCLLTNSIATQCVRSSLHFVTNVVYIWQEFLKKEQERKEAELLAEKQELLRKRKEEKRLAREVF